MIVGRFYTSAVAVAAAFAGYFCLVTALSAADKVEIEMSGSVGPYCSNSAITKSITAGDLHKAGSRRVHFMVNCNAPFQYTMQSDNGALRLSDPPDAALRDEIEVPYSVQIVIPLTLGGTISDTCTSSSIKRGAVECKFTDSGLKVAIRERAETLISWDGKRGRLLAGQYTDRLTFAVTAKL